MKVCDQVKCILDHKSGEIWSVTPETSVYEALELMEDKEIGALLVMDDNARLLGILSERDYARKVALKSRSSRETFVREIMTSPPITVGPTETVDACMRVMTIHRVRHLPVTDGDRVLGMLSQGDLVHWIIQEQDSTIDQLEHYITGAYPG